MSLRPTSEESLDDLRRLRDLARERGDDHLAVLLAGIDMYASMGREFELLEIMKQFADEMKEAVENTPTAADLKRLFERDTDGEDPKGPERS